MTRKEPTWLTILFSIVGLAVVGTGVGAAYLVAIYWPIFVAISFVGAAVWWQTRSSYALERQAREGVRVLLLDLANLDTTRFSTSENFETDIGAALIEGPDDSPKPPQEIIASLMSAAGELYAAEQFTLLDVPEPPTVLNSIEGVRYQQTLRDRYVKLSDPAVWETFAKTVCGAFKDFSETLPPSFLQPRSLLLDGIDGRVRPPLFSIPVSQAVPDTRSLVENLILPFYSGEARLHDLFAKLRRQLDQNLHAASGVPYAAQHSESRNLIMPTDYDGSDVASTYLQRTPLEQIFTATVPFDLPHRARVEHWHLVAGSGHGKTQTLQHVIVKDLASDERPALIVVDSQGDMLRRLSRLALFEDDDRLVVINPEDDDSPALNMFDVKTARLQGYSRAVREQVEAGILELFNYVFGALASELTAKQGTAFAYITRLMLAIPGATIHTFRELMETADPSSFAPHIARLDPTSRAFFENQFFNRGAFGETRQQIARRLYTVLQVPAFERMFASPVNRLDMFSAMQERKVVLINTSKALLKTDASALFGRYMIALTLNAAFERVAVTERERVPAYLIIDEAAEYFDATLERLLAQARKFNLGVLFAHQHMDQLSPALRSAVAANTSIKMAGGVSDHDARLIAPDMRTTPDFIGATRKRGKATEFACYARNFTEAAVHLSVPFGTLERAPRMSKEAYAKVIAANRARYATSDASPDPPTTLHRPDLPSSRKPDATTPPRRDPDDVDMHATEI